MEKFSHPALLHFPEDNLYLTFTHLFYFPMIYIIFLPLDCEFKIFDASGKSFKQHEKMEFLLLVLHT